VLIWHYHDEEVPGPAAHVTLSLDGLPKPKTSGCAIFGSMMNIAMRSLSLESDERTSADLAVRGLKIILHMEYYLLLITYVFLEGRTDGEGGGIRAILRRRVANPDWGCRPRGQRCTGVSSGHHQP
jgi:hypothetical protein